MSLPKQSCANGANIPPRLYSARYCNLQDGRQVLMQLRIITPNTVLFAFLISVPISAQWLDQPDPRIPRTKDGKPNLTAKPPRAPDGKPDLAGVWTRREGESAPVGSN